MRGNELHAERQWARRGDMMCSNVTKSVELYVKMQMTVCKVSICAV